ncbi:hypothetical protein Bbelb_188730, partial [Branchiostoma belcheri]
MADTGRRGDKADFAAEVVSASCLQLGAFSHKRPDRQGVTPSPLCSSQFYAKNCNSAIHAEQRQLLLVLCPAHRYEYWTDNTHFHLSLVGKVVWHRGHKIGGMSGNPGPLDSESRMLPLRHTTPRSFLRQPNSGRRLYERSSPFLRAVVAFYDRSEKATTVKAERAKFLGGSRITMAREIVFDYDYLVRLEESSRKLESDSKQRLELLLKAQREVDTYLEQLNMDHPTGWAIPPQGEQVSVQAGPDQAGPDQAQAGLNKGQWPLPIQENAVSIDVALRDFSRMGEEMEREGHPGHMAMVPGNSTAPAAIGDFLAASFNPYPHHVASCWRAVKMQQQIVQWAGQLFGYPRACAGNLTSGGTVATMVAMATARDTKVPQSKDYSRSVLYISELTHDGVAKCLNTLGMREAVVRKVPVDDQYGMDVNMLRKFIQDDLKDDLLPFLVVATVGTTDAGSADPVPAVRAVATQYDMWLHVDACYGGFFALCNSAQHLFEGVDTADSISVDPHK